MSKTLEGIKTQWAKDHSYENYFEFLDLTRKCDTDHVFIMDGAVTQIAKRYAQSQTKELQEQNAELIDILSRIVEKQFDSKYSLQSLNSTISEAKELLTKHK